MSDMIGRGDARVQRTIRHDRLALELECPSRRSDMMLLLDRLVRLLCWPKRRRREEAR